MKNFKANIGKTIAVASGAVTIADLAQPVAPFAAYLMGASAIFCLILSFIKLIGREFGEGLTVSAYLGTGIFVMSSILYFYQASSQERMQKGLIASQVSQFESLQYSLGMIDKKLVSIDDNLTSIDRKVGDVKKETSENPRKELANLGLTWTGEDFHSSIMNNDREIIEMYFRGGMQIDRNYDNGYSDNTILLDMIFNKPKGWETTLEMAYAYGYDFNEAIFHHYGLGAKTIYDPPHYIALTQNRFDMAEKLASFGADTDYSRKKIEALLAQEQKYASREVSDCTIDKKNIKSDFDNMMAQNKQYECQVAAGRVSVKVKKARRNVAKYKEMLSHI